MSGGKPLGFVTFDEASDITPMQYAAIAGLPERLSLDPNSPDFHPCYVRVGLRVDGVERDDVMYYNMRDLSYMTTNKTSHLATALEPYWRWQPSRQQRRAEQRWEEKHRAVS